MFSILAWYWYATHLITVKSVTCGFGVGIIYMAGKWLGFWHGESVNYSEYDTFHPVVKYVFFGEDYKYWSPYIVDFGLFDYWIFIEEPISSFFMTLSLY